MIIGKMPRKISKKNAIEGRLEVEFSLEDEDKLFFNGEDFQKEYDGLTKLILNED